MLGAGSIHCRSRAPTSRVSICFTLAFSISLLGRANILLFLLRPQAFNSKGPSHRCTPKRSARDPVAMQIDVSLEARKTTESTPLAAMWTLFLRSRAATNAEGSTRLRVYRRIADQFDAPADISVVETPRRSQLDSLLIPKLNAFRRVGRHENCIQFRSERSADGFVGTALARGNLRLRLSPFSMMRLRRPIKKSLVFPSPSAGSRES